MPQNEKNDAFQSTVETAFYHNNVQTIDSVGEAYYLAANAPRTLVTDLPVKHTQELGLPKDARVLVDNNGSVVGRTAVARRIIGVDNDHDYTKILQDAIAMSHERHFVAAKAVVGLSDAFSMAAHVMVDHTDINNLYNFMINFEANASFTSQGTIFLYVDSTWTHPEFPKGLVILDPKSNSGAVLGLNYFGEIKKAVLSLAWHHAKTLNFVPCHGGLKQITHNGRSHTMAVFGLSGSGKSTITLAEHGPDFDVSVLHDDAFLINKETLETLALEPSYFDKTADYPMGHPAIDYFISVQNNGVTLDATGRRVLVTEDIRNGNGRTIKSRYWTKNRVDSLESPVQSIFWIMKDDAFPPLVKINDPVLASALGATMTTTRSNAENTDQVGQLVVEPYANPFRLYPLVDDYIAFKDLFKKQGVECYILNTGHFNGKKITPEVTLGAVEAVATQTATYEGFGPLKQMQIYKVEGFVPDFNDETYVERVKQSLALRNNYLSETTAWNWLPLETQTAIDTLCKSLQ
ncbi:phosphoenolpyruvate carboxykinase (ATP) [Erysipelothrix sp. HDW6C]|uniref:phosphoenolpyruvate carboxykinase (ATP) n=1 Tax=Erysipelothrix sp. HDW6C TaxID=2714930 RepID=UPI0014081B76|nr:phosphoenolpyruvate carboxykinase (ATP) [Erysipelothrix sp. HDW6C]QIK69588.1 phosphoenolpyruvate carboxykinase (ATP) [Erysipelothrix sp. HDW6C]